jgi:ABC-2 type transport system ATP-binding protein
LQRQSTVNNLCLSANATPRRNPTPIPGAAVSVIETRELRKYYGRIQALKGVSLSVQKGQIYGLLGQNGAGKTTLIKILLGIAKKTDGDAELLGRQAGSTDVRRRVGYLPEDHQFPTYHTGYSLMEFYGTLYGVSKDDRRKKIPETLELVGIAGRMNSKIKTYSKGMKQRLGIAQSLLHDPEVIFLDEPTDGVDPLGRREIRELMGRLKEKGHTIFLNSHLLGEVELICDRVAILQRGQLIREGTIDELTKQKGRVEIGLASGQEFPIAEANALGFAAKKLPPANVPKGAPPPPELWEVGLTDGQTIDRLTRLVFEKGLNLRHLVEKKQSLEDAFLATVEGAEPGVDKKPGGKATAVGGRD